MSGFLTACSSFSFHNSKTLAITPAMTNRIALGLGLFLAVALAVNYALGLEGHIFIGRKFIDLVRLIAFWR
jgi:hypothetical protein